MPDRIERTIDLHCPPSHLWHLMTDGDALAQWLADEVELELTPGGEARFRDGDTMREGWVEDVPPADDATEPGGVAGRLAFWWGSDGEPASRVELTLIALADARTRLLITETRPLDRVDLVGIPLPGSAGRSYGPALVAA